MQEVHQFSLFNKPIIINTLRKDILATKFQNLKIWRVIMF